jgi:hypothetical protein
MCGMRVTRMNVISVNLDLDSYRVAHENSVPDSSMHSSPLGGSSAAS